jgi:hypothetical protein
MDHVRPLQHEHKGIGEGHPFGVRRALEDGYKLTHKASSLLYPLQVDSGESGRGGCQGSSAPIWLKRDLVPMSW